MKWNRVLPRCQKVDKCPKPSIESNCIEKNYAPNEACECATGYESVTLPKCRCNEGLCRWSKSRKCSSKTYDYEQEPEMENDIQIMQGYAPDEKPESEIGDLKADKCVKSACWDQENF